MNRYQSYKPSGVEWIGEIPSNWNVTKIKYIKKDSKDSFIDGDWIESKDLSDEGIRYITSGNIGEGRYKEQGSGYISEDTFKELNCTEIFEGDLVISRLFLPVGRSCILPNLNNNRVITCVDNVVLRPKESFNKSYLNYQFNSNRYSEFTELISRGVTLTRISRGMLGNNSIVVPPLQEQLSIVQFLDEKTELIDKLISTKERKITLLKEQRTSVINQVVTKGLNPNVKLKDSGVEWIGEIPEHWMVSKFKFVSEIVTGNTPSKTDGGDYYSDEGFLWIKPTYLKGDKYVNDSDEKLTELGKHQTRVIPMDSIMICCIGNTIGKYGMSEQEVSTNQQINSVIPNKSKITPWYCLYFVDVFTRDLLNRSNFVTLPILTKSDLENIEILLPTLEEQVCIVENIKSKTKEINDLVNLEQKKIDLLKEYRQSLISEVVTGKVKVTQ